MSNIVAVALNITLTVKKRGFGDSKSWKKIPKELDQAEKNEFCFRRQSVKRHLQ